MIYKIKLTKDLIEKNVLADNRDEAMKILNEEMMKSGFYAFSGIHTYTFPVDECDECMNQVDNSSLHIYNEQVLCDDCLDKAHEEEERYDNK